MEFKSNFCFILLCVSLTNLAASLKYDFIGDCHFLGVGSIPGGGRTTFICAENGQENNVFTDSKGFKCSNDAYREDYKWPGTIDFQNCRFPTIKRNFFEIFYNIRTFNIPNVELETLQMNIEAKNMIELDVSQNRLSEIPSHIFFNAANLKYVNFSNNTIKRVDPMAFEGAIKLETLNLSNNQIVGLDSSTLCCIPDLLQLDLSNNNVTKLSENIFDKLLKLKELNLSFNAIGDLEISTFTYLINLEHLSLRRTNLTNIQRGTFLHQHKLVSLDLSENNLKKLDFTLFLPIQRDLRSLRLGDNHLNNLYGFRNTLFPQLNLLDIQGNPFNCSYLAHFMESVDWDLHFNVSSMNVHKLNIRGISCDITTVEETTDDETSFNGQTEAETAVQTKTQTEVQIETHTTRGCQNTSIFPNYSNESIIKISNSAGIAAANGQQSIIIILLAFICIAFTIFLILFTVVNRNRIANPLKFYQQRLLRSSKGNVVEFSNEGILIT